MIGSCDRVQVPLDSEDKMGRMGDEGGDTVGGWVGIGSNWGGGFLGKGTRVDLAGNGIVELAGNGSLGLVGKGYHGYGMVMVDMVTSNRTDRETCH